jgi:nitrogen fixation NifU-like protein
VNVVGQKLLALHYHGYGCAVSMAAGSVLVKSLEGKTIEEAVNLCNNYLALLDGKEVKTIVPEEFRAFIAVKDFPARYECAAMAWMEMKKYLMKFIG